MLNAGLTKRLSNQLYDNIRRRVRPKLKTFAYQKFLTAKRTLLSDIKNHPISQEIDANEFLFGFLGFEDGRRPIQELVKFFNENISIREGTYNPKNRLLNLYVNIPSKSAMAAAGITVEWRPQVPWPEMVETGIPYLQYFMRQAGQGRSDEGVQAKGEIYGSYADYPRTPYLSVILSNFRKNLIA